MKPYPAYKPTDLPWLPQIPEHWEIKKLRTLLSVVSEKGHPDAPLLSVVRERGVIIRNTEDNSENHNYIPDELTNYKYVRKGQFAMNKMKAWQGSYGISNFDGIVSPAYFVFNLKEVTKNFFNLAIRSKFYVPYFGQASDGIRVGQWDLSIPRMKEIPFAVPTVDEQAQIARYLDSMTAKINKLIRAKKKQIALLQEQKQAIINQAVTKGLNPNAEMKDSGIDWLGLIPKHWDCISIKYCAEILPGLAFDSQSFSPSGKYFLLRGINIGVGSINHEESIYWPLNLDASTRRFLLRKDDIVLGLDRPWIKQGLRIAKISESDIPALLVQRVCRIRPNNRCKNDFLLHAINVVLRHALQSQTTGISVPHISTIQVGNVKIPIPPIDEQLDIIGAVAERIVKLDRLINKIEDEIDVFLELRDAKISSVVTGQVDVRSIPVDDFDPADLVSEAEDDLEEGNVTKEREEQIWGR